MMLIKILVVNNSVSECLIIKKALMEYNVLIAYDGLKAMRQIDEHKDINLVILDLKIPKIDGFQILSVLKSADKCKKLRTIILTDYDGPDIEIKGLKLDAVDYVRKPIDIDSFKARINIHVELLQIQHLFEQKQYEHDLTYDTIFHQAPIGISISHNIEPLSANMNAYTKINPMFEQITGRTKEELIKLGWEKITHPDDLEEDLKNFKKLKSGEIKSYSMEKRYIKPDGSNVWVHIVVAKLKSSADNQYSHICLVQDITRRKEIEADLLESERSKSVLLSHLPGLAYRCSYDQQWTMQFVSDGCFELTGYLPESLLYNKDISFNDIIAPEYHELLWEKWKDAVNKRQPLKYEYEIITAKGERKWVLEMGQGIYNEQGEVEALEGIILDASDRKEIENNFRYNNEHDKWTGLYNCNYLEIMLKNSSIEEIMKNRAVVDINLSAVHTLTVNYGFNYSQDLMKKIADILSHYCTEKCLLFRTFETHFAFYINDYKDKNELIEFCETVANTLEYILLDERIGGGIGVVELDQDNENDINQLLKKLLIASEKAIDINDRDFGICFYNAEIEMQMIREQNIKRELTKIASDENGGGLFLQYQPILDLKLNRICGFEALARLKCDKLGLVPPLEFIPIAEKTKLIIPIGQKIILKAFYFLKKLKENGYDTINVSINVSVIQLLKNNFCNNIFNMINEMQISPANISLEITESVLALNYEEINNIIGRLKDSGIIIAIDDFGTGYSSLARERELNVNCLKIDKYFIDNLLINPEKAITGDIISMAHKFDHYVIAEGVENEKQRQYLADCGCDKIQGYLVGKPLDEESVIELLKNPIFNSNG